MIVATNTINTSSCLKQDANTTHLFSGSQSGLFRKAAAWCALGALAHPMAKRCFSCGTEPTMSLHSEQTEKKNVCAETCYRRAGEMIQTSIYRNYCKIGFDRSSAKFKREIAPPRLVRTITTDCIQQNICMLCDAPKCTDIFKQLRDTCSKPFQSFSRVFQAFPGAYRFFKDFPRNNTATFSAHHISFSLEKCSENGVLCTF